MDIKVTDDFAKWANGFAGCDGGNITAPIWFCGIEYGGNEIEDNFKFLDVTVPPEVTDEDRAYFLKYQYNIKVAKIYMALVGHSMNKYYDIALKERIFSKDSNLFKLNLYPISFHHDSDDLWEEWLYLKTGLATKSMYRAYCQISRFKEIKKWVKTHSPKAIIATGISYRNEFIMAFDEVETIYNQQQINTQSIESRELTWLEINDGKTLLFITPFFGSRHGLNSDLFLQKFADEMKAICNNKFGLHWI